MKRALASARGQFFLAFLLIFCAQVSNSQTPVPAFEMKDINGILHNLEQYKGKITIVSFWATWCVPCKEEMPVLVDAYKKWKDRGLVILAASFDNEQTQPNIPDFVKKYKMQFPVLIGGTPEHLQQFEMGEYLPATVFINQNGEIVSRILGQARKKEVVERVEWLLGDRPGKKPPAAIVDHRPK